MRNAPLQDSSLIHLTMLSSLNLKQSPPTKHPTSIHDENRAPAQTPFMHVLERFPAPASAHVLKSKLTTWGQKKPMNHENTRNDTNQTHESLVLFRDVS
jgi:hypothetical protein